ncbi:MAG TPA: hypothetical protein DDX92_08180 [Flavobacteriales bacterium]|jgi:plasmid stabilization system protein ParE|nr:hypothetical protein [Flavobacteriales bacterium]
MALKIVWTERAEKGYASIIDYLEDKFTEKKAADFVRKSKALIELLSVYPELLTKSNKKKNIILRFY